MNCGAALSWNELENRDLKREKKIERFAGTVTYFTFLF